MARHGSETPPGMEGRGLQAGPTEGRVLPKVTAPVHPGPPLHLPSLSASSRVGKTLKPHFPGGKQS